MAKLGTTIINSINNNPYKNLNMTLVILEKKSVK